jgi:hypothetical protein
MISNFVPKDSILISWLTRLSVTEIPVSYQIVCGLSAIGALLKRQVYVDQLEWGVFPNMSVLLIGPSGIGKDVIIAKASDLIARTGEGTLPCISGRTIENLKAEMLEIGDPAACFIPAPELTAYLGKKDYQKSMMNELTDMLSTNDRLDVSTKSERKRIIPRPTITMQTGSTADWLYRSMPEGALEGGFFPRFVIVCEEYGNKHVPLLKYSITRQEREVAQQARIKFDQQVKGLLQIFMTGWPTEIVLLSDARMWYENWYENRFSYFSSVVRPYANRSRDQFLRLAMLMAISRSHTYVEEIDCQFAGKVIEFTAASIDKVIRPWVEGRIRTK